MEELGPLLMRFRHTKKVVGRLSSICKKTARHNRRWFKEWVKATPKTFLSQQVYIDL